MIRRWLALTYYLYALRLAALSHFYFNPLYNEKQVKKQPALWVSECRLLFCRVPERILPWFHCPYPSRPLFWSRHKNTVPANAISTNVSTMALW